MIIEELAHLKDEDNLNAFTDRIQDSRIDDENTAASMMMHTVLNNGQLASQNAIQEDLHEES